MHFYLYSSVASLGCTVVQYGWLALSPHSKNVLGLNLGEGVSVLSLHVPVSAWVFFLGTLVSSDVPKTCKVGGG